MQFDEIHADLRPEEKLAKAGRGNGRKGSLGRKQGVRGMAVHDEIFCFEI